MRLTQGFSTSEWESAASPWSWRANGPNLRIVGIDVFKPSLRLARENVEKAGLLDRIELREQGAEALEDDEAFDLAWMPTVFMPERVIPEATERTHRALRPAAGWCSRSSTLASLRRSRRVLEAAHDHVWWSAVASEPSGEIGPRLRFRRCPDPAEPSRCARGTRRRSAQPCLKRLAAEPQTMRARSFGIAGASNSSGVARKFDEIGHAAGRRPSTRFSQTASWFQLALFWSTILRS